MDALSEVEAGLAAATVADAAWAAPRLAQLRARQRRGQPIERGVAELIGRLRRSAAAVAERVAGGLVLDYPEGLPVCGYREQILSAVRSRRLLVLVGETGSGKTTQLPKMLIEAGYGRRGAIALTQPRRLAAVSVAARLREECQAAEPAIAHAVRFDDRGDQRTRLRVCTDGLLLAEAGPDADLLRYDAVVVDEAHERSLNVDVLLGLLTRVRSRRPDLAVVVASATIDAGRFAQFLADAEGPAPIVEVPGRLHPVTVRWRPPADEDLGYLEAAVQTLRDLHRDEGAGDVLCFLPTERDILDAQRRLGDLRGATILPCFGRLTPHEQQRIFEPTRGRKIVLATNIAETSLTVPGIRFVVDAGLGRLKRFSPQTRTERLPVEAVSQASCRQRAGRAGRLGPGICVRLFDEADFNTRPPFTEPEIRRSNLAGVLLTCLALGIPDPTVFPWLDAPPAQQWREAREILEELGALEAGEGPPRLSTLGRRLARIPADPQIARMLVAGVESGCAHEVATLAAFLSVQDPRVRPLGQEGSADAAHASFRHEAGDLATVLALWDAAQACPSSSARARWCSAHFVGFRRWREWADVRRQFWQALKDAGWKDLPDQPHAGQARPFERIHRSVLTGLPANAACWDERQSAYRVAGGRLALLHPGSGLRRPKQKPLPWILAAEIMETSRCFARLACPIEPEWLEAVLGARVERRHRDPHYDAQQRRVVCVQTVTWKGLTLEAARRIGFERIDPAAATAIFCLQALAEGQLSDDAHPALAATRALIREAETLAARLRDGALHPEPEGLAQAYQQRLAPDPVAAPLASATALLARVKGRTNSVLERGDLLDAAAWQRAEQGAPLGLRLGPRWQALTYRLAPGRDDDGVSIDVEERDLPFVAAIDWLRIVPGWLDETVAGLLAALPKDIRRQLIPLRESAQAIAAVVREQAVPLPQAVAHAVREQLRQPIPSPTANALDAWLRPLLRLRDDSGEVLFETRDPEELLALARGGSSDPLAPLRVRHGSQPSREWPDDIPERVELGDLVAWPALLRDRDEQARVAARVAVFSERGVATAWHSDGVEALLEASFDDDLSAIALAPGGPSGCERRLGASASVLRRRLGLRALLDGREREPRSRDSWDETRTAALERLRLAAPGLDNLISAIDRAAGAVELAVKRSARSLATAAAQSDARQDFARLLAPGWDERFDWAGCCRLPAWLQAIVARLTAVEADSKRQERFRALRERLLDPWDEGLRHLDPRVPQALGLVTALRQAATWREEALAAATDSRPGIGEGRALQALDQILDRIAKTETVDRQCLRPLREWRPVLDRVAPGPRRDALAAAADHALHRHPDLSHGCDIPAQRLAIASLVARIRRLADG